MVTAIDLYQHALLGHAPPPEPVLRRATTARAAHACPGQDAAHRGTAQVDGLALSEQFGKVSMVGAGVVFADQLHHCGRGGLGDGVVGPPSPVPVGQCGGTVSAIGREKTLGVALAQLSIARTYGPVVARVIEPPCGPVDGLSSPLGLRVNHLLSVEQGPVRGQALAVAGAFYDDLAAGVGEPVGRAGGDRAGS